MYFSIDMELLHPPDTAHAEVECVYSLMAYVGGAQHTAQPNTV